MVALSPSISEFTLVGTLEDFAVKSNNRVKYLQLATDSGDYLIKVAKERNNVLSQYLQIGCNLKVMGMQKNKLHCGEIEYKAYRIELLQQLLDKNSFVSPSETKTVKENKTSIPTKAKVLFCQKSTCWQQGGRKACELLKAELQKRNMTAEVEIKTTGCLKQCKQAPNMVILPDRALYSRVRSQQIPELIDRHLTKK